MVIYWLIQQSLILLNPHPHSSFAPSEDIPFSITRSWYSPRLSWLLLNISKISCGIRDFALIIAIIALTLFFALNCNLRFPLNIVDRRLPTTTHLWHVNGWCWLLIWAQAVVVCLGGHFYCWPEILKLLYCTCSRYRCRQPPFAFSMIPSMLSTIDQKLMQSFEAAHPEGWKRYLAMLRSWLRWNVFVTRGHWIHGYSNDYVLIFVLSFDSQVCFVVLMVNWEIEIADGKNFRIISS